MNLAATRVITESELYLIRSQHLKEKEIAVIMSGSTRLTTRHQWIDSLAMASPRIAGMKLDGIVPDGKLTDDGGNFANDDAHRGLIIRAIDNVCQRPSASLSDVRNLLVSMIRRDTYGKFAELAAYDWLIRSQLQISAQIPVGRSDILGAHDNIIDGRIDVCGIYFDIKAFGFNGY
jgi:hypothetical protein